jgi:uncharacterized protein YggE
METKPDTIKITASHREEVRATHADLYVTVKGSSLVSGDEALKKAKEVSQLVEQLTGFGLPSEEIHLQSVFAESTGGALLRSSSAVYRLRLRCNKLEQVPDLLSIIAAQKNATFERVDWKYPDDAAHEKGLEQALAKASARASRVAAGLGVKLLGVYRFSEDVSDDEAPFPMTALAASQPRMRAVGMVPQADLGMDIQHSKNLRFTVEIEYRVAGFDGVQ